MVILTDLRQGVFKPLLFRAVLAVDVTGLLAIIDPFFHFPLVLSCLPTHLVSIPFINCCVFNPLYPVMSLSEIVCYSMFCIGVRQVLVPTLFIVTFTVWSMFWFIVIE